MGAIEFWNTPQEEQEKILKKAYELIRKYKMEVPAVMFLETMKPFAWVGGEMLRIALSPYMIFFWREGHALIDTFESRKNLERLIKMLEESHRQEEEMKEKEKASQDESVEEPTERSLWKRFLSLFR
jgi:hypothetical protein